MSGDTQPLAEKPIQDWKIPGTEAYTKYQEALDASIKMIEEGEWPVSQEPEYQGLTKEQALQNAQRMAAYYGRHREMAVEPTPVHIAEEPEHVHGPFFFAMNQYHNALRGCVVCGQSWAGSMSSIDGGMRWHVVEEE